MKPSQLVATLHRIASDIERSKNPDRNMVARDLKKTIAAINQFPMKISPTSGTSTDNPYVGPFDFELIDIRVCTPWTGENQGGGDQDILGTITLDGAKYKANVTSSDTAGTKYRSLTCDDPSINVNDKLEELELSGSGFLNLLLEGVELSIRNLLPGYDEGGVKPEEIEIRNNAIVMKA
jgi:hypothetical protein